MPQRSFLTNFARDNLRTSNLRRFFGDYRTFAFAPDTFHLGIGEIANITPDATWQHILQDFYQDPQVVSRATMYAGTRGEEAANQAVAEHVGHLLGRPDLAEQHVLPYDGGHNAVQGIIRTGVAPLGSRTDERQYVLLPTPCYPYFSSIINAHCGILAYTAYTAEEVVQGIETLINPQVGVVLLNSPHNPTGYAFTAPQVERINQAVEPYDCVLAVDMVYALNALDTKAIRALGKFAPERTIYIDSFSKKFGLPGYRLGFAICTNLELLDALRMMKAAESISTSNVKLLLAAHLLRHHLDIADVTASQIRLRYHAFRAALSGIQEYGVDIPPLSGNTNAFYLPLFLERLLEHTGSNADEFANVCQHHYHLDLVPGTRMYPPVELPPGRLQWSHGKASIHTPGQVIYAPDFPTTKRPFLRLSFGMEHRITEAAARLQQACAETFVS